MTYNTFGVKKKIENYFSIILKILILFIHRILQSGKNISGETGVLENVSLKDADTYSCDISDEIKLKCLFTQYLTVEM